MWFLALKQLLARPQQTILTFVAILIGSAGYVVFSSMMLGFQEHITNQLINSDGQIKISPRDEIKNEHTYRGVFFTDASLRWLRPPSGKTDNTRLTNVFSWMEKLEKDERVSSFAPQLNRQVIFSAGKFSKGGRLAGIDPARQKATTNITDSIVQGELEELSRGDALIIIGEDLMGKLGARMGDTISVAAPGRDPVPVRICGVYRSGNRTLDEGIAWSSLKSVQKITGSSGEISDIIVRIRDLDRAAEMAGDWSLLTRDKVQSWDQANETILSVFKTQDITRNTITLVIILIIAFGIYNILNMVVSHKKRDIAILRGIGYGAGQIVTLFLYQGLLLGFLGALFGLGVGYLGARWMETIEVAPRMGVTHMIISFQISIYVKAFLLTTLSSLAASFLPARAAARLTPIEIIRGEQ